MNSRTMQVVYLALAAIVFEAVKGRIARYRAGLRPQVEYVEGCG